jgi:hypothetical protein
MRKALLVFAFCLPMFGCGAVNSATPPAALAPGYLSAADQTVGEGLAAVNSFVTQEKVNYAAATATAQAAEKATLNALITATDLANAAYTAYHAGTGTLPAAQTALTTAQNAQAALAASKGVQ